MNALLAIARKDALLLWRDKAALFWILGLPLLFASFFGTIFSSGGGGGSRGSLTLQVIDEVDHAGSKQFVARLAENSAVKLVTAQSAESAETAVRKGQATAYIRIVRMAEDGVGMFSGESPELVVGIDPSRQAEAGMLQGVVMEAVFGGMRELFTDLDKGKELAAQSRAKLMADEDLPPAQKLVLGTFLGALEKFFDQLPQSQAAGDGTAGGAARGPMNPDVEFVDVTRDTGLKFSSYDISFPQAIAWALMSVAFGFALSLVRERSDGTMLRLATAPIGRGTVLGGKWLACAGMAVLVVIFLMLVGKLIFGIQIVDPAALLVAILSAATAFAGLMMLLGTLGKTEAAASGAAWGVLMPLAMLGGGMVPQIAMPKWMLTAGVVSPIRWTIEALEGASWRGYTWGELLVPCAVLVAMGLGCLALGRLRLRGATI